MTCKKCGKCCQFVDFTIFQTIENIAKTLNASLYDVVRYYGYHNIEIVKFEDRTTFRIKNRCDNLDQNNLCKMWEKRPSMCRQTIDATNITKPEGCTD